MSSTQLSGAVLMGHGSREPGTTDEIRALVDRLAAALPAQRLTHAFLNSDPRLGEAVETLVTQGCTSIRILPLLVFTGRHMIDDVPAELERLRALHPDVTFTLDPYLYRLPGFAALLASRLHGDAPASETSA